MNSVSKEINLFFQIFYQKFFRLKTLVMILLLWFLTELILSPVKDFAIAIHAKTTPAIFTFLLSNEAFLLMFMLGILYYFCDVPFTYKNQMYVIIRMGKQRWLGHQLAYIIVSAITLIGISFLICIIQITPIMNLSREWDKVLGTLALTEAAREYGIVLSVSYKLMTLYSPLETVLYSILIGIFVIVFIGVFMLFISILSQRIWAISITCFWVLLPGVQLYGIKNIMYFSPVSWIRMTKIGLNYQDHSPGIGYILCVLTVALLLLTTLLVKLIKRKDLEWINEE